MATTTTTIGSSDLLRILQQRVADHVYYHGEKGPSIMGLAPVGPVTGGTVYEFPTKVSTNGSAATFSEGDDPAVSGQGVTLRATAPWTYFRAMAEISGHVEDDANGTALGPELVRREFEDAMRALMAFVKRAFLANSTIGLVGLIDDSTTNWHGHSRATYPALVSHVEAGGSATLSATMLSNVREAVEDAPYEIDASNIVIVSRPNIRNDYLALAPQQPSGGTTPINVNRADISGPRTFDIGWMSNGISWNGSPWITMTELAATLVLGIDRSTLEYIPHRDWRVDEMAKVRDSRIFQYSHAGALASYRPRGNWKIEALT